jgi:protein-tyrosine-phosphatase
VITAEAIAHAYGVDTSSDSMISAVAVIPVEVEPMKERGSNVASNRPKMLAGQVIEGADYVVTMACRMERVSPKPLIVKIEMNRDN